MADILRSDVYKAYAALGRKPKHVSRHYSRNGIYKAQLGELYCRMPDCDAKFDSDGRLQRHLDTTHGSIEWNGLARGTYRGKDLMNFCMDLMKYEDYPGKGNHGEQVGSEDIGTSPPQRPRRTTRAPLYRDSYRTQTGIEDDDDDDDEEQLKIDPARTPEQAVQRQGGVYGASERQTPANQVIIRGDSPEMMVRAPAYEEEEQELEFKRKELDIERRRLELEQRDLQLQREQAALRKRRAAQ